MYMQDCVADFLTRMYPTRGITKSWSEITLGKLEIIYNLIAGNDIESTYELLFAALSSMQVLWNLLRRVILQ